ncbi:MAG: ATP-binding cassette domain-containing protein [Planctomycetaceae bacterium]|jgi:iron(III) transport system ATP-binding protein
MPDPLWRIDSVVLNGTQHNRLDGVTCSIAAGVTAILGSSGAGKTSLLGLLAELEKPDSGTVQRLFHADAGRLPLYWAPQGGGLWPHLTVRQHLTEIGKDGDSADKLLSQFDLTDRQSAYPGDLSQGERARLSVVRALAVPASVLLFDEPLVHVDGEQKMAGWQTIRTTIRDAGAHLVLTTHEPEIVLREADSVICLKNGQLEWNGPVLKLYYDPPNEPVGRFLGPLNWFETGEQQRCLPIHARKDQARCLRPEQLQVEVSDDGLNSGEVVSSDFMGSHAETTVRFAESSETRTLVHRPPAAMRVGEFVVLRVTAGCRGSDAPHG